MKLTAEKFPALALELASQYPELGQIVDQYGLPEIWQRRPGLQTLVLIILEQQISVTAAATMFRRLAGVLGGISGRRLADAGQPGLREVGLTRQKARYCHELGKAVVERRFSPTRLDRLSDEEALATLIELPGIGPWSAAIYLMSALRRMDIWPPGDLALNRSVDQLLKKRLCREAKQSGRRWRPYRTVAAQLLWHHYRQQRLQSASR